MTGDPEILEALNETDATAVASSMTEVVEPAQLRILIVGDRETVSAKLKEAQFESIEYLDTDGRPQQ